jgi:hypothetical protein
MICAKVLAIKVKWNLGYLIKAKVFGELGRRLVRIVVADDDVGQVF